MDVKKTIAELTSQLSEVNYESEEENLVLRDAVNEPENLATTDDNNCELGQSLLRKRSYAPILPEKTYQGKKTSRKRAFSLSESSDNELLGDKDNYNDSYESDEINTDNNDEENDEDEESLQSEEESNDSETSNAGNKPRHLEPLRGKHLNQTGNHEKSMDYKIYSEGRKNIPTDIKKGSALKNQLKIWDSLLECRIKMQKSLSASNNLPTKETFKAVKSSLDTESHQILVKCRQNLFLLLKKINELQEELLKQSNELKTTKDKDTSKMDHEILSDESEIDDNDENEETLEQPEKKKRKLIDFAETIKENHAKFIPFRNASIQKWNDKTKVSAGKMANSNFSAFDQPTLKQIEQIMGDKTRLINRTRVRRNDTHAKSTVNQELVQDVSLDPEIFDDTDFYHKLLRDYIERKTSDTSSSSNTERQMIELQKLRSKMKRSVDTKSSKGRKLRFVVLPKLVNFMAPNPLSKWSEEAETELYNSLFGQIKAS